MKVPYPQSSLMLFGRVRQFVNITGSCLSEGTVARPSPLYNCHSSATLPENSNKNVTSACRLHMSSSHLHQMHAFQIHARPQAASLISWSLVPITPASSWGPLSHVWPLDPRLKPRHDLQTMRSGLLKKLPKGHFTHAGPLFALVI